MKKTKLILNNFKLPSWNLLYSGIHWVKRQLLVQSVHNEIFIACREQGLKPVKSYPVDITVTAYQKRPVDSDNLCVKLVIDGLKLAKVIKDDNPAYVGWVNVKSVKSSINKVDIEIE